MRAKKDIREWKIVVAKSNIDCDYLSYPANYHACNHPSVDIPGETECTEDTCPIKPNTKIQDALDLIYEYGGTDGDFHQKWLVDQLLRVLTGEDYDTWVKDYEGDGEYEWDEGAPI